MTARKPVGIFAAVLDLLGLGLVESVLDLYS
jgi:hypothetical protein